METKVCLVPDASGGVVAPTEIAINQSPVESVNQSLEEVSIEVDQLQEKVDELERFYSTSNSKNPNSVKDKDKDKFLGSPFKNRQQDAASREAAAAHRMQDLMRQFGTILRQLTQHKWAEPFMQPVDVVGLALHDYYEVIEKPMDFSTIKCKMEAKDGTGYKHVREMCADVRLIFKNAMKYNKERDDVHVMAKTLLDKFETKWLQLLPKIDEEEKRLKEEEAQFQLDRKLEQEAAYAKMARNLRIDLDKVDEQLEELRGLVLQNFRRMTTEEKKRLGSAITRLSLEDINKVLEIVGQNDPATQAAGETVDVDLDAQSNATLWRLMFFVKVRLQSQMKSSTSTGGNNNDQSCLSRRKREFPETAQRKSKKPSG